MSAGADKIKAIMNAALDEAQGVDCTASEFVDALETFQEHLEDVIGAAAADIDDEDEDDDDYEDDDDDEDDDEDLEDDDDE